MSAAPDRSKQANPSTASLRAPFRNVAFRRLWGGGALYFIGGAMQAMATSWLMVELTHSALLVALVQTAVFLPMFLLSLPAGVLSDTADRYRLIRAVQLVQLAVAMLLALLVALGQAGPASLLVLTFVFGCCAALQLPAFNSSVIDRVPREQLPQAITALSIAYNGARAGGPLLAGLVFAYLGAPWVFVATGVAVLVSLQAVRRYPPKPHPPTRLPAERMWGGILSALRFARHTPAVLAQLVRTMAYGAAGSALWALLPLIGAQKLGLGAAGFGAMMGCMGGGAICAGLVLGPVRARLGLETLIEIGCVLFALVMLAAALLTWPPLVYLALFIGGGAWTSVMSTFNTATQSNAPPWVRSRAMALHTLSALGAFAIASALWGMVSSLAGLTSTLVIAAICMLGGLLLGRPFPLRMGEKTDVTQAGGWDEVFIGIEPDPEAGPIAVEISYRIDPRNAEDFLDALTLLRAPRKRDGATLWRAYRDLGDPSRYCERFIVTSWADYLHQRARATQADQQLEAHVREYLLPGETPIMQHYIAER